MQEFDLELVGCFCDEATDLLVRWEALCLEMSKTQNKSQFDELFRLAHNLKGSSRSVGLESFGNCIHKIEDGITLLKKGEAEMTSEVMIHFLKIQTFLQNWIDKIKTEPNFQFDFKEIILELSNSLNNTNKTSNSLSNTTESKPSELNEKPHKPEEEKVNTNLQDLTQKTFSNETSEVSKKVDQPTQKKTSQTPTPTNMPDETVRVSVKKIEQLIEMMGELSIHQSVVYHSLQNDHTKEAQLSHSAYLSRKITRELYEKTLSLRMVPVQPVFQRLERTINEMSKTLGKNVETSLLGGEVELDKTVCEKIVEPLTHMVRNSIDHGIEKPEDRLIAGKKENGLIRISAFQEAGSVAISIEDDGKGLDVNKIKAKAISQGLITEDTVLEPTEVFSLIFLPGFSTAEKVTDVSGRGVGMDIVMKTVEGLKGEIKIGSELGKGTKFLISLPTSLSIIDALIINIKGTQYAVPVNAVDEIININEMNISEEETMMKLGKDILPILNLSDALNINRSTQFKSESIIITKSGKNKIAFRVDEVCEQQQIVVRKFSSGMENVFGLSGGTILGNGQPGLIIDLNSIADFYIKKTKPQLQENVA